MELKFGCEVLNEYASVTNPRRIGIYLRERVVNSDKFYLMTDGKGDFWDTFINQRKIILGRPIRLADVLNALWIGEFDSNETLEAEAGMVHEIAIRWNLKDDNLDNQSEETINFLFELLCK